MRVETVQSNGTASWMVGLVGANSERFRKVTMSAEELARLTILDPRHTFNGDGRLLRLGLQAYALGIAYEFDPYFGLSISRVDPLRGDCERLDAGAISMPSRLPPIRATGVRLAKSDQIHRRGSSTSRRVELLPSGFYP
jgi:hypothetical protein